MSEQLQLSTETSTAQTTLTTSSAFSTKQILSQIIRMTKNSLPSSPPKKVEVIGTLAKSIQVQLYITRRKKNKLCEKEEEWIQNFLERSDITYATPGRRDTVYVGMDGGNRQYK